MSAAIDHEALRSAPRVLMIGEAPPATGNGPLGVFDCDSGWVLARLDPHHDAGMLLGNAGPKRAAVVDTLRMFDRVNLLRTFPGRRARGVDGTHHGDVWPEIEGRNAALAALPSWAGRRVALMGRRVANAAAQAGGLAWRGVQALPVGRWLTMGGPGEPAEVCVLYHPSPSNRELNYGKPACDIMSRWIGAERARLTAEAAWMTLDAHTAYRYGDGAFLNDAGVVDVQAAGPEWRTETLRQIALNCCGQFRFTGRGMSDTAHHLLTDEVTTALIDAGASPWGPRPRARASIEAMTHDLREGLTHDLTSPLKKRHPSYRADERRAAQAVERLLGLPPTPAALVSVVHRADMLVREVESVVLWGQALEDSAWPAHLLGDASTWEARAQHLAARGSGGLLAEWTDRLTNALEIVGSDLAPCMRRPD